MDVDLSLDDAKPARLFSGQRTARSLGAVLGGSAELGQLSRDDIEAIIQGEDPEGIKSDVDWLRKTSLGWCSARDVDDLEACQREFIQKAVTSRMGDIMGAPLEHHDAIEGCGVCKPPGLAARIRYTLQNR